MLKGDGADGEGGCGDSSGSGGGGGLSSLSAAEGRHSEAEATISQAAAAADPAALFAAPPVLRLRGQTRLARCPVRSQSNSTQGSLRHLYKLAIFVMLPIVFRILAV